MSNRRLVKRAAVVAGALLVTVLLMGILDANSPGPNDGISRQQSTKVDAPTGQSAGRAGVDESDLRPAPVPSGPDRVSALLEPCVNGEELGPMGSVTLRGATTFHGRSLRMVRDCDILLADGAHLVLRDVYLQSRSLVVRGDSSSTVSLSVINSTLSAEQGGLLVDLGGPEASILIKDSTVSYSRGIWLRLIASHGAERATHVIEISDARLQSSDASGDGIAVAASERGGHLSITRVTMEDAARKRFIFAGTCVIIDLSGAEARCRPVSLSEIER